MLNILKCFLAIGESSVENSLFGNVHYFLIGLFELSNFLYSLYVLEISPLLDVGLVNMLFHSMGSHFVLLMEPFA